MNDEGAYQTIDRMLKPAEKLLSNSDFTDNQFHVAESSLVMVGAILAANVDVSGYEILKLGDASLTKDQYDQLVGRYEDLSKQYEGIKKENPSLDLSI